MKQLARPFEIKSINEDGVFEGYGAVFGNLDSYRDIIMPGAFAKSIAAHKAKGSMPALLWQHRHQQPIGVYEDVFEDDHGLFVRGRLLKDDVAQAREAYALMKVKAVTGLSIGYDPVDEQYDSDTGINLLKEVDLWEVSPVTFPANDEARIQNVKTVRDFEGFLRDAGFSKSEAVRIASKGFNHDPRRDAVQDELANLIKSTTTLMR